MRKFDVIIIGSGLGGLVCGNLLSKEGFSVCILEKHHTPGGNLQTFMHGGIKFDTGVHYIGSLGEGQVLNRYWKYLGLTQGLKFKQLDVNGFDIIRFGDTEFPLAQNPDNFIEQLIPHFPGSRKVLSGYMKKLQHITACSPLYNLEVPGNNDEEQYRSAGALGYFNSLGKSFSSDRNLIPLASVLAGNNFLYAGSEATPLHMAAMINHSFISGAYRIIGGSIQIADILSENISSKGGVVLPKKEVISIRELQQKFIAETHDGEMFISTLLISDIHPQKTFRLMPDSMVRSSTKQRIDNMQNTPASFILHLGLKPGVFPYFNRNYYIHQNTDVWKNIPAGQPDSMFLLSMSCSEENQKFTDTATIMTYDDYSEYFKWESTTVGKRGSDYIEFKNRKAEKLLAIVRQYFPDLINAISHTDISTPLTYRDYTGIPEGSLYGIMNDYRNPLLTTVMPRTKIPNFYFTGQNVNLHGVLGVTIGAVMTCGEILGIDSLLMKIRNG